MISQKEKKELNVYESKKGLLESNNANDKINNSNLKNSIVSDGCIIYGTIENSIIYQNVYIGKNVIVKNSIIMPNVRVNDNSIIKNVILSADTCICNGSRVTENKGSRTSDYDECVDDILILEYCG